MLASSQVHPLQYKHQNLNKSLPKFQE